MLTETTAMDRALALGWRGWGRVSPNPMVGCVLLAQGETVGEGWHAEFGGVHAEQMALTVAGARAREATAVVTLEPCTHTGKQPPCTEALLAAGVRRVVVAVADPHPVAGGGAARLRAGGVAVDVGLGAEAARYQLAGFLHRHRDLDRPWIALKLAVSLDGRIADGTGHSQWISGPAAREWVHWLRAGFSAIGVGGTTAGLDNPSLTVRGTVTPRVTPRRVIFAGRSGLRPEGRLLATAGDVPTIIVARPGGAAIPEWEAGGATVLLAKDLDSALHQLRQAGIDSLLVEGGGRLAGALLHAGVVDRVCLIQAPLFLGDAGVPAVAGWDGLTLEASERWVVLERRALGVDTLTVLDRA